MDHATQEVEYSAFFGKGFFLKKKVLSRPRIPALQRIVIHPGAASIMHIKWVDVYELHEGVRRLAEMYSLYARN